MDVGYFGLRKQGEEEKSFFNKIELSSIFLILIKSIRFI